LHAWDDRHGSYADRLLGAHAAPKGLRHGFGVAAVSAGIPLNLVQKWLGRAQLSTTALRRCCRWRGTGHRTTHVGVSMVLLGFSAGPVCLYQTVVFCALNRRVG
jgi:hypothetical protein